MEITFNTDIIAILGIVPAVVAAICNSCPELTTREIARLIGRDYSRTAGIIRDLKKRGFVQNAQPNPEIMQNAQCDVMQNAQIVQNAQNENENENEIEIEKFPPYPLYKDKDKDKAKEKENANAVPREARARGKNAAGVEVSGVVVPVTGNVVQPSAQVGARVELSALQSLQCVAEHAKAHPFMLEQYCLNTGITADEFTACAKKIQADWLVKGVTHANVYDARQHFYNQMRYVIADYRREHPRHETPQEQARRLEGECARLGEVDRQLREMCRGTFIDDLIPE